MSVFASYAAVYDALYADKDYAGEAAQVAAALRRRQPGARTLLELGCGTGLHAIALAEAGFDVTGIDLSPGMLARAAERRAALPASLQGRVDFRPGDARLVRLDRRFDAVISLFHVASYQAAEGDLAAMFATAAAHLAPGGHFLFDFWYGPGVLAQRPEPREKRVRAGAAEVRRLATPTLHEDARCVDVAYDIQVLEGGNATPLREVHRMRYFSMPEIERALREAGFTLSSAGDVLDGVPPDARHWAASVVARRN